MKQYTIFSKGVIGNYHIKKNKPYQDYVGEYENESMSIVAVADGHGSEPHFRSDIGSKIAVETAIESLKAFIESIEDSEQREEIYKSLDDPIKREDILLDLKKSIVVNWHRQVREHYENNPVTSEELKEMCVGERYIEKHKQGEIEFIYGSTLIAALMTESFCLLLHIGDGTCAEIYSDGIIKESVPLDPDCHDGYTTSMCQYDAVDSFRHFYTKEKPVAVLLTSDGVTDTYDVRRDLEDILRVVPLSFLPSKEYGLKFTSTLLERIALNGKEDDTSMAGIIDVSEIEKLSEKFNCQLKLSKSCREINKLENDYLSKASHRASLERETTQRIKEYEKLLKQKEEYDNEGRRFFGWLFKYKKENEEIEEKLNELKSLIYGGNDKIKTATQEIKDISLSLEEKSKEFKQEYESNETIKRSKSFEEYYKSSIVNDSTTLEYAKSLNRNFEKAVKENIEPFVEKINEQDKNKESKEPKENDVISTGLKYVNEIFNLIMGKTHPQDESSSNDKDKKN